MRLDIPIQIRPLEDGDLDGLDWDAEEAIGAAHLRKRTAERGAEVVFLLAFANGRPVGRIGLDFGRKADQGIVHLYAFSVLPALQRLGIGTALMRAAESLIASAPRGATVVEVGVDEWNHDAARLYHRLGYRESGSERNDKGEVILLLSRPVAEL